jgi:hypothetical protein
LECKERTLGRMRSRRELLQWNMGSGISLRRRSRFQNIQSSHKKNYHT